jgi:transposase
MMGRKTAQPKLYVSFSLDEAVPPNHLVRRLAAAVDFSFVRGLTRRLYSHTGQPSADPEVLFKLWLLGYLFNVTSERRLCEEAGLNLAWRWFLGYELDEALPDHSVLSKARRRFGPKSYERFFTRILQFCEQAGLVQGDILFVDSTLTKANAAPQGLRSRSLLQQKLGQPQVFVNELWVVNDDPGDEALEPQGYASETKRRPGRPPKDAAEKRRDSRRSAINELSVSLVDPDAQTFRKPGRAPILGHKTHFVVDGGKANIITAVESRAACEADGQAVGTLLDKHRAALSRQARELVGDRGYGSETALKDCVQRGVQPLLGIRTATNPHGGINREQFTFVPERDLYVCPQGKELKRFAENIFRHQTIYKPVTGACQGCPVRARCAPGQRDRVITRRWDADVVEEMLERSKTHHSRRQVRRRQVISERINANAKEKHGFARAQFRGRAKMQIQALLTAAAMNLKQLAARRPEAQSGLATRREAAGAHWPPSTTVLHQAPP